MEKAGIFSLVDISERESKVLLSYLRNSNKTPAIDFVNYLIGTDYLKFLDLLAGTNLKIPSRKSLYRDIEYVKVYTYIKDRNFEIDSFRTASRIFGKNISFVKRAVIKISKSLGEEIPLTIEEISSIKSIFENKYEECKDSWAYEGPGNNVCEEDLEFMEDDDNE